MAILILVAVAVTIWVIFRAIRSAPEVKPKRTANLEGQVVHVKVSFRSELTKPDPAAWERERAARIAARDVEIEKLKSSFTRPNGFETASADVKTAISKLANTLSKPPPDIDGIWADVSAAVEPRKVELAIRKRMNDEYKHRADTSHLMQALACCVLHVELVIKYGDASWKVAQSIKRLARQLDHERCREHCVGFLLLAADGLESSRPDLRKLCLEEADGLFRHWHFDRNAKALFESSLGRLEKTETATDRHFLLNNLIGYLGRRRRFEPALRAQFVESCEQDLAICKDFLCEFNTIDGEKVSFARVVRSDRYFCPSLPSFDALWELYDEEGNVHALRRIQKLSREIKYREFEIEELDQDQTTPEQHFAKLLPEIKIDVIEAPRSGAKGKLAFLDSSGSPCSTETAAIEYFQGRGFKVLRGEVQFWQAMFGLAFWEEIFNGTGLPDGFNDIPSDLFSGAGFYRARATVIDRKARIIEGADLPLFMEEQLRKYGAVWTRIVYDGGRNQFAYRDHLASQQVADFLAAIPPATFAKIVHRIAVNPAENRAGLPDYTIWHASDVQFIEVKGERERIRDTQISWINWMQAQGFGVKVVRVKAAKSSCS